MDSILPHLWARRARAVWDGAAGGDQRLESIKCRAALCRFTGGVAVQEASGEGGTTGLGRDRGREGDGPRDKAALFLFVLCALDFP
jgi:hypothetical protein